VSGTGRSAPRGASGKRTPGTSRDLFRDEALRYAAEVGDGLTADELRAGLVRIRETLREGEQALAFCGLELARRERDERAESYWLSSLEAALHHSPTRDWITGRNPDTSEVNIDFRSEKQRRAERRADDG
jgi:hypothetical protein